jgi:ABC-type transport system substrate-binding protein
VGSGPYKFRAQQVGTFLKYEAADWPHWYAGVPKYKYFTFYRVNEESTRIAMLKTGEADVIQISRDKAKEVPGFALYNKAGSAVLGLYINNTWDPETCLSNEKFREALSISINREEIRDYIFDGRAEIIGTGTIYGSYALGYEPVPLEPYDPERARQLVQEAFPGDTPKLNVYVFPLMPEMKRVAEALAGYWKKIGVESKIIPIEYSTYRKQLAEKDSPTLANSVGVMRLGNRLLWDGAANILQHSEGLLSMSHDPHLDKLIEALRTEADPNLIGKRQRDMALYLQEKHYQIGIVEVGDLYAANPDKVPEWPHISAPLAYELYLDDLYIRR